MGLRTPDLCVVIAVANMDLYPYDLPRRANWGSNLEQLVPYLEETGCHDFEIHPTTTIVQDIARRSRRGDMELADLVVGSLHQTFNNEDDLLGKVADRRGILKSSLSVTAMNSIQAMLSARVPAVHYPYTENMSGTGYYALPTASYNKPGEQVGSFSVVQPKAETFRDFGVRNVEKLLAAISRLGYLGLCPDTVHARRKAEDGTPPPPLSEVWSEQFASGHVYQMHVGADRVDMAKYDAGLGIISAQEYEAFTSRHWQRARDTEMGEMITSAIENWVAPSELLRSVVKPVLRQVIEIPPRPRAILHRIAGHARFVENLAEVIREAGATPILWGDCP